MYTSALSADMANADGVEIGTAAQAVVELGHRHGVTLLILCIGSHEADSLDA